MEVGDGRGSTRVIFPSNNGVRVREFSKGKFPLSGCLYMHSEPFLKHMFYFQTAYIIQIYKVRTEHHAFEFNSLLPDLVTNCLLIWSCRHFLQVFWNFSICKF